MLAASVPPRHLFWKQAVMDKYLVLYRSTMSMGERMANTTPESMQTAMQAWMAWAEQAGDALVDFGSPTQAVGSDDPGPAGEVGGYSILQAEDADALGRVLEGHPHRQMGTIEVLQIMPRPGMSTVIPLTRG